MPSLLNLIASFDTLQYLGLHDLAMENEAYHPILRLWIFWFCWYIRFVMLLVSAGNYEVRVSFYSEQGLCIPSSKLVFVTF